MSRRLWMGFEITEISTPPILAASSTFSIVAGGLPFLAPTFLWKPVPVKVSKSSGGKTWVWKSIIIEAFPPFMVVEVPPAHCRDRRQDWLYEAARRGAAA